MTNEAKTPGLSVYETGYEHGYRDGSRDKAALLEALQDLMDWQNGPPLPTYEKGWTQAMKNAAAAILKATKSP